MGYVANKQFFIVAIFLICLLRIWFEMRGFNKVFFITWLMWAYVVVETVNLWVAYHESRRFCSNWVAKLTTTFSYSISGKFWYIFDRTAIKSWVIFSLEILNATVNARDNRIALWLSNLGLPTHHRSSLSAFEPFHREEDRDLSGTGNLRSVSFRIWSLRRWTFWFWYFHFPSSRTVSLIPTVRTWGTIPKS